MDSTPSRPDSSRTKTPRRNEARTPNRRAISAEPPSSRRSVHTPLDRTATRDLGNSVRRGISASGGQRNNAPTPHAIAALKARDQRRTALFTPGKERRRSQLAQRGTPMEFLRNLGKVLAPTTNPIVSSSSPRGRPSSVAPIQEEDEDDLPIDRPSMTLPIDEDDESELLPPRSSVPLDDENVTIASAEMPRRALSEQPGSRLSRGSFGSVRDSDVFDTTGATEGLGRPSDFFPGLLEELQARADAGSADVSYSRTDGDTTRPFAGRGSDFGLQVPAGVDDQTTFLMSEPPGDAPATSPIIERSVAEGQAGDAGGVSAGGDVTTGDIEAAREESGLYVDEGADDDFGPEPIFPDAGEGFEEELGDDSEQEGVESRQEPAARPRLKKRQKRISKHGIEYPPLPPPFVKRVAQTALQSSGLSNPRVSTDTLAALTQASEWFFEQLGDDLGAYAHHAKRKTIEESDVATLMRRQRQITSDSTMFSLAQRHLPRELLQDLRMPGPPESKKLRSKRMRDDDDDDDDDASEVT